MSPLPFLLLSFVIVVQSFTLDCPALPDHVPANVTDLRPNNIKVVMAMGDSITAAFGAGGAQGGFNESRGVSATIGGDSGAVTLANFLQYYSPDIQGASLGTHLVEFCGGDVCPPDQYRPDKDVLNSAQSGAMVVNLNSHELNYLLKMLKSNPNINMQEDWKLLSIFIGANDLCGSCDNNTFMHPDDYEANMINLLEAVRANIPKVFVQIVELFNISQVYPHLLFVIMVFSLIFGTYDLSLKSAYCTDVHRVAAFECGCLFDKPNANTTRQLIDEYCQEYNARSVAIAARYQALNYPEFTVVSQPAARDTMIKDQPIGLLSTLDCFHPSLIAHQAIAIGLWNNLLTPAAQKKTSLDFSDIPMCPTPDTLLYTY